MAETPKVSNSYRFFMPESGSPEWTDMPYAPKPEAEFIAGKGILLTTGAEPILWWYGPDGTLTQKISLDLPTHKVSARDKAVYRARLDERIEEAEGYAREFLKVERKDLIFPEARAYWTTTSVDDAGYIWLRIPESSQERELAGGGYPFHLLSPDGEYLGVARLPEEGRIIMGRLLAVVEDSETGEQIPTVWRLVPSARGFTYP